MAEIYKIENKEELLAKLNEEIEIIENIYDGEGVILEQPIYSEMLEADVNTESSGKSNEEDE
jgi:uncharacterized protein YqeY